LLRLDFDRAGRLIFFELSVPRRQWPVDPGLELPPAIEPADLRWLDFRGPISVPALATDPPRTLLRLTFAAGPPVRHYFLGQDVFASVDDCDALVHLWIRDIVDDLAGQEIGAFRKKHRSHRSFFAG
ncbi:MAG TPA: hypothetical protein PKW75_12075, partial [candidate division Zixibacteria bacterium]|nr:hypothetical protein [candidate division Zixibacteria bacterium]